MQSSCEWMAKDVLTGTFRAFPRKPKTHTKRQKQFHRILPPSFVVEFKILVWGQVEFLEFLMRARVNLVRERMHILGWPVKMSKGIPLQFVLYVVKTMAKLSKKKIKPFFFIYRFFPLFFNFTDFFFLILRIKRMNNQNQFLMISRKVLIMCTQIILWRVHDFFCSILTIWRLIRSKIVYSEFIYF